MAKITLEGYRCERCGHEWVKRAATEGDPVICPKCKSPYWNRPRVSDAAKKKAILEFYGKKKGAQPQEKKEAEINAKTK